MAGQRSRKAVSRQELAPRKQDGATQNAELAADLRALQQTRQIYHPPEGKAGLGQQRGLAQAPREKTSREAAITPAVATRPRHTAGREQQQLLAGPAQEPLNCPAVLVTPEAGRDTTHLSPVFAAHSAAQQDPLSPGPPPGTATALLV